ncbi:hypothetical protein NUU61_004755 [Penicillium alfredii]|uniref:NB-ARC domain-containing protein n=1 Tax=Penicillium alfredii TaxID=1506179 RepID=A0A9W9K6Z1_9EURO|nr:uncharacterized protein NUU61_004755 [Penicillium alfredii]KAJ5095399.1 hypothetical protein NUU61_004755 [Penicillium alfredii]
MSDHPIKAFGLTQVYVPRDEPKVDIVLVHGLNGHPHDSWTSKSGCFWPVDLLPDILASQRPRILTYGYNANVTAFTDGTSRDSIVSHAETLASNLAANRNLRDCSDRPIIFVCHSLGGLVVKRALIYCYNVSSEKTEHLRSIYVSTFGILFLGTPHNGSDIAKWGLLLHNICSAVLPKKVMEASPQLVKALRTNNETLQHINSLFANIMSRFHIYFFHETRSTDVRGTREIIVDEASAAPYMDGVERMGIEADHSHMCKFEDENAPGYEVVAEAILRYSRQAPTVVADRWVEEKKARTLEKKARARELYDGRVEESGRSMPDLTGHSVLTLPPGPATDGQNSPASELSNSGHLPFAHEPPKELPLLVAPPGFHPNATFYGMKKELEVLHHRLFKAKARPDRTMAVLISGVPGSGKTHLAREYVFKQRESYTGGIFWIDAKSRESAYKCFWEIAQAAMLIDRKQAADREYQESRTYVNAVRNWLQTRHEWLLIFDGITFNHDDQLNEFRHFLPWNKRCSIIYTSIDTTLRKKQRLYEPYCLLIPRLHAKDACQLLYKDLGIKNPTPEQALRAMELVEHYDCLPLAIHAIGHRLNATGKPIEKYRVKYQLTDKKLAEPFLSIMNDLYRMQHYQALNLINLLSFLGHQVPVGLLNFGRSAMSAENAEILTSAQTGEDADLDTTLGTLIHHGLVERTSDADPIVPMNTTVHHSDGEDKSPVPELSESLTESSQEGFFSIYRGNSAVDVVKIHSVVQGFCRDELRIKDEEYKEARNKHDLGFYDSWLIVTTRFLCTSYENAKEKMAHYQDCGLVRDYREFETHASRLAELFPKKPTIMAHPLVLREARETLRQLMKSMSSEIDRLSPSSSQESVRNQRSVFDRSSSSSSSIPDSSADEGPSRRSTWTWNDLGSPRAESPEEMATPPPRFKLDLFPPSIFRKAGYESEGGYDSDTETNGPVRISPALSQMSQTTEKPNPSPASPSTPPPPSDDQDWQVVDRHSKAKSGRERYPRRRHRGPRRFRGKPAAPLVKISNIEGRGSSSRTSVGEGESSSVLASAAEKALAAVRRSSNTQPPAEPVKPTPSPAPVSKENIPTYASVAARRMLEADAPLRRPASMPISRGPSLASGLQMKASVESLDSQGSHAFTSPLSHELTSHELMAEPLTRSTYSEPGQDLFGHPLNGMDLHTAPGSRRTSLAGPLDPVRDLSASTPSLLPYPPPLPYEEDIAITIPRRGRPTERTSGPSVPVVPRLAPIAHPSAIMPGALPLSSAPTEVPVVHAPERPSAEALSRGSSGYSHQSWATEPVRYPPRFSPVPSFQLSSEVAANIPPIIPQQQALSGAGSWTTEVPLVGSALQSDVVYPVPAPAHPRLGSVDERLKTADPGWDPQIEPARLLHFGGHRVDVRDARQRLQEAGRLQTPRHVPTYQLYHPNLSGPLIQDREQLYAPAPALEVYGMRARRSSSPPRPNYEGLGVRL